MAVSRVLITLCIVHRNGVTTIGVLIPLLLGSVELSVPMFGSCLIYWTRRNHQYGLRLEDMYLELNAFPDQESNPEPFDLELIALTPIPPCFGFNSINLYTFCRPGFGNWTQRVQLSSFFTCGTYFTLSFSTHI